MQRLMFVFLGKPAASPSAWLHCFSETQSLPVRGQTSNRSGGGEAGDWRGRDRKKEEKRDCRFDVLRVADTVSRPREVTGQAAGDVCKRRWRQSRFEDIDLG